MEENLDEIEKLSPEEIQELIVKQRKAVVETGIEHDNIEKKIAKCKQETRDIIPEIPQIQEVGKQRVESLEKIRRLERKLLSLYTRFPGIINPDSVQMISTDISVLTRQLETNKKREQEALLKIEDYKQKIEVLTQKKVDLVQEDRLQGELMQQRDQEKNNLAKTLKLELDQARTLYSEDIKNIDQKIASSEILISSAKEKLENIKVEYKQLLDKKLQLLSYFPPQVKATSQSIITQQEALIENTYQFLDWWASRRRHAYLTESLEFIDGCALKSKEREDQSYKLIENIKQANISSKEKIQSTQQINDELTQKISDCDGEFHDLKKEHKALRKSFKPLPEDISTRLEFLRRENQEKKDREKSLIIEYKLLTDSSSQTAKAENRLDGAKRRLYKANFTYITQQMKVLKLEKELEEREKLNKKQTSGLSMVSDPRLLLTEDEQPVVAAAPWEILCDLLFDPNNTDETYIPSFLVAAHTDKVELAAVIRMIVTSFNNSNNPQKSDQMSALLSKWKSWYDITFNQASQLESLISLPPPQLIGDSKLVTFDDSLEVDPNVDLAFSATPLIIAEHLYYYELEIIKSIPMSEFTGTGWTKPDKWMRAPNVMKMTEHFNLITNYINMSILNCTSVSERATIITRWILIMAAAKEILEFQLVFEIYGALCNPSITRLEKTWEKITPEANAIFNEIQTFTSPMKAFGVYRRELMGLPPPLVVPYIGPMLTNLVYTHDGNPAKKKLPGTGEEVVNLSKYRIYSTIMSDVMKDWGSGFRATLSKKIIYKIKQLPLPEMTDSDMYALSSKLE